MMVNEPTRMDPAPPVPPRRQFAPYLGAAILLLLGSATGYLAYHGPVATSRPSLDGAEEQGQPPSGGGLPNYRNWQRPSLALVVSGQMHGYFDPCGCSEPQYGGLVRRYNFIDSLRAGAAARQGWDVVGIDLGELPSTHGNPAQNLLKYELTMNALATMNYRAVGIGKHELLAPLDGALAQAANPKRPMPRPIGTTLEQTGPGKNYHAVNARPYEIIADTNPKLGVISMIGPDLRKQHPNEKFLNNLEELPKALHAFAAAGVEIAVILHHEYPDVPGVGFQQMLAVEKKRRENALTFARLCDAERKKNPKIPPIGLVMVLVDEPEPPFMMRRLDPALPTQLIEIGHKGKYVGLVGIFREKKLGYRLEYQAVLMSPDWKTKPGNLAAHPVIKLQEQYHQQLKQQNILGKYPRTDHVNQIEPDKNGQRATYVGSNVCGRCHEHAETVWDKHPHAKATDRLEQLKFPSGRQFDPECMMCHTVGLKHNGGYQDPPAGKKLDAHNLGLRGVGCESCHGPGSAHVKDKNNKDIHKLINPYGPGVEERQLEQLKALNAPQRARLEGLRSTRMRNLEQSCIKCHDHENDVNWKDNNAIEERWFRRGTVHRTPGKLAVPPPAKASDPPAALKVSPGVPELKVVVPPRKK